MSLEAKLSNLFTRFASTVRVQVGGDAVTRFMVNAPGASGRNNSTGVGSLRRITGRLSRSFVTPQEMVFEVNIDGDRVIVEFGSKVEYAAVHEFGFSGSVTVPGHTRTITQAFGRPIAPRQVQVRSFVKNMNIPARPYLAPAIDNQNNFLKEWLEKEAEVLFDEI
jgi:phage gpG-like protein